LNRRFLAADGSVRMHGSASDGVAIIGPEGPTDPEGGVLFALDEAGRLLAAAVNYTCHPTAAGNADEDAAVVGLPVELFVELGLETKARSPIRHTWIVGDASDTGGYIPTRQAFARAVSGRGWRAGARSPRRGASCWWQRRCAC
jgi:hypothetical protein